MKLALILVLAPMISFGMDRLAALSMLETGDNDRVVGRAGEISRTVAERSRRFANLCGRPADSFAATRRMAPRVGMIF